MKEKKLQIKGKYSDLHSFEESEENEWGIGKEEE